LQIYILWNDCQYCFGHLLVGLPIAQFDFNNSEGRGDYSVSGTLNVYNSTISGNYARRYGGGIRGVGTIINSIIWGNTSDYSGANITGTPTITYSDVQDGYAGAGCITMGGYDYHGGARQEGEVKDFRAGRCMGAR